MKTKAVQKTAEQSPDKGSIQHTYTPRVDIYETINEYLLEAEMPGVDEKNVDVKFEDGVLNILGRVYSHDIKGYKGFYTEYEVGNFERSFEVSDDIDVDKIQASMKHGILTLTMPKREAVRPKCIEVKAG